MKLSTKGHMHILIDQSKNEKLLKNLFETVLRYSFEIKFETSAKYRAIPIEKYPPSNKNIEIDVLLTGTTYPQLLLWQSKTSNASNIKTSDL